MSVGELKSSPRGPTPFLVVAAVAVGLFTAMEVGSYVADSIHATAPWMYLVSLGCPIALASAIMILIGRRI
jgi:hypothetical protein